MMFGLPAACLAMYHSARPERRKATGGMLLSLAATSFLTGVTEPIEFSFMFLAPLLYALHAVLTGAAMALMAALGVHLGFGFSAGLFDYVLNFSKAQKPLLLIPVGLAYAGIYYGVFRWAIVRFDLKTPGRDDLPTASAGAPVLAGERGQAFAMALGGAANLVEVGACTTRLRLVVADQAVVDEAALRALGAKGLIRPSPARCKSCWGRRQTRLRWKSARRWAPGAGAGPAVTESPPQPSPGPSIPLPCPLHWRRPLAAPPRWRPARPCMAACCCPPEPWWTKPRLSRWARAAWWPPPPARTCCLPKTCSAPGACRARIAGVRHGPGQARGDELPIEFQNFNVAPDLIRAPHHLV
jgi:glucose-like phosphotransferase system IIB component